MKTTLTVGSNGTAALHVARTLLLAFFLTLPAGLQASALDAHQIAKALDIPGKNRSGECERYAQELFQRLDKAGVEAYKIVFNWESYNFYATKHSGTHAMVVFKDGRGRYYGMDNKSRRPVWLNGSSPEEWTAFFVGMDMGTGVANSLASRAAASNNSLLASR